MDDSYQEFYGTIELDKTHRPTAGNELDGANHSEWSKHHEQLH